MLCKIALGPPKQSCRFDRRVPFRRQARHKRRGLEPRVTVLEDRTLPATPTWPAGGELAAPGSVDARQAMRQEAYGQIPLSFEANLGQTDAQVQFLSRGNGYALFLTDNEAVLSLQTLSAADSSETTETETAARAVLRTRLVGANSQTHVLGQQELPAKVNYFVGIDASQWRSNVPTYAGVEYQDVYPGVDLVYYGNQQQLEYDFIVAPGVDPSVIRLGFTGADTLEIDAQGDLVLQMAGGPSHKGFLTQS